jgi:hypothetical protein
MDKKKIPLPAEDLVLKKMRRIDALTASELAQAKKSQMKEEYTLSPAEGIVAKKIQVAQLLLGTPRDNLPRRGGLIHSLWRAGGVPALEYVAHRQRTSVVTIIMEGLKTPGPGSATFKRLVEFRNVMPIASQRILIVYHAKLFSGELELPPKRPEDIPVTGEKPAWKEDFSGSPPPRSIPRGVESKARMQNRALAKTARQQTPEELKTLSKGLSR